MNEIIISKSRGLFRMYIYAFNGLMPVCLGRKLRWINIKRSLFSGTLKKNPGEEKHRDCKIGKILQRNSYLPIDSNTFSFGNFLVQKNQS
jgi:hypothetical protein